jgi:hypothetical protein
VKEKATERKKGHSLPYNNAPTQRGLTANLIDILIVPITHHQVPYRHSRNHFQQFESGSSDFFRKGSIGRTGKTNLHSSVLVLSMFLQGNQGSLVERNFVTPRIRACHALSKSCLFFSKGGNHYIFQWQKVRC